MHACDIRETVVVRGVGVGLAGWALCMSFSAWADRGQDAARAALARGDILPLVQLIPRIEADLDGTLVEIELERRGARWVYEAEVLSRAGERLERDYDAASGAPLGSSQTEEDD